MTIDAGESAVLEKRAADAGMGTDADPLNDADAGTGESLDVYYSCLRCGTSASGAEISRLPEIKCICGFKVFTKVRPPVAKTVRAV